MAELDREILFSNEAFVIGMLQVVSGGSIIAALSQAGVLIKYAGRVSFLLFITIMAVSLVCALLAAYWKHQYKMWDVKAQVSASRGAKEEATERSKRADSYLKLMRCAILVAVVGVLIGVSELVAAFWYQEFYAANPPNNPLPLGDKSGG